MSSSGCLAEVVPDHRGHEAVDRLVVGHAVADHVGDRDVAGARRVEHARAADQRVGTEVQRVEELVVDAAVDHVDAVLALGRAHVDDAVAAHEVATLYERHAHLAGEERVLEVRRVVDARASAPPRWDRGPCRSVPSPRSAWSSRPGSPPPVRPMALEQVGEDLRHGAAVLDDVGDPRRAAQVVLEHPESSVRSRTRSMPATCTRTPPGAGSPAAAVEVRRGHDQPVRDDAVVQDRSLAVDVGEEGLEGPHPLDQARARRVPLLRVEDPGTRSSGNGARPARERERDALVTKRSVAPRAPRSSRSPPARAFPDPCQPPAPGTGIFWSSCRRRGRGHLVDIVLGPACTPPSSSHPQPPSWSLAIFPAGSEALPGGRAPLS